MTSDAWKGLLVSTHPRFKHLKCGDPIPFDKELVEDIWKLVEAAVLEERDRCVKIADTLSREACNDAAGGMAHAITQGILGKDASY